MLMLSSAGVKLAQFDLKNRVKTSRSVRTLRRLFDKASSALIGLAVMAIMLSALLPVLPVKITWPTTSDSTTTVQTAAKKATTLEPKTYHNIVASPAHCSVALTNADTDYSSCPNFALDFAKIKPGAINPTFFNTFVGAPFANEEKQYYTASQNNLRVDGGNLVLQAQNTPQSGYSYTSARIDTKGKEDFMYGKLVIRAKMPAGVGTWPSIWLLPSQPKYAQLSPGVKDNYNNDGELDIAEAVGMQPHVVYAVAHTVLYNDNGVDHTYFNTVRVAENDQSFHDYEMDWTPTKVTFKVDGATFFVYSKPVDATYKSWPFDQPFYLILNLAVGGTWAGQKGIDSSALPASLSVQSIHYYEYKG